MIYSNEIMWNINRLWAELSLLKAEERRENEKKRNNSKRFDRTAITLFGLNSTMMMNILRQVGADFHFFFAVAALGFFTSSFVCRRREKTAQRSKEDLTLPKKWKKEEKRVKERKKMKGNETKDLLIKRIIDALREMLRSSAECLLKPHDYASREER